MRYELRGNFPFSREEFEERLKRAERYFFSLGMGDIAEEVGRINAIFFLAKLHFLQENLGYQPKAMIIGATDFSFQTSPAKFRASVPEGAKIIWGDGNYDFIPAEMEFDFCGMLVGGLETEPKIEEILDRLDEIGNKAYEIDGISVETEEVFRPGNHFLNLYKVKNHSKVNLPKNLAILHCSSNEFRKKLINFANERAERISTPFGHSLLLKGGDAKIYQNLCQAGSLFALKKRQLLFEEIFGKGEIIANHNHYELIRPNQAVIGCNLVRKEGEILELVLRDNQPAYLIKAKKNLPPQKIEAIFGSREIEDWSFQELLDTNFLPHGGGHCLLEVKEVEKVIVYPGKKIILGRCQRRTDRAYLDLDNAFRRFRSQGILERVLSLGLADHLTTLECFYSLKVDF